MFNFICTFVYMCDIMSATGKVGELFDVNVPAISKHLFNIFEYEELIKEATVSKMEMVQKEAYLMMRLWRRQKRSNKWTILN